MNMDESAFTEDTSHLITLTGHYPHRLVHCESGGRGACGGIRDASLSKLWRAHSQLYSSE